MDKLVGETGGEASEQEAEAVAKAIGLSKSLAMLPGLRKAPAADDSEGAPLSRVQSGKSDYTSGPESPSPTGVLVPDPPFPGEETSPDIDPLESPAISGDEAEDEKEERAAVEDEEHRGRAMIEDRGPKRTGAKSFVFPKDRRGSS